MKIAVAVKQVLDFDDEAEVLGAPPWIELDPGEGQLNEWDEFALEAGLGLRDEGGGEVVALSVGDDEADAALVACLARGADRAIRIDAELDPLHDPLRIARLLADVITREQPDLVLCGVQSSDGRSGATGPALAGLLDVPVVGVVTSIELEGDASAKVARELEGGALEYISVPLPAVLTVQTGANRPRYANLRAIKRAEKEPREVVAPAGDAASTGEYGGARVVSMARPEQGARAQLLEGSAQDVAESIAGLLAERLGP